MNRSREAPLYLPQLEHDACGIGLLADLKNRASHEIVERGLAALGRLAHRGGGANRGRARLPDGAGVLTEIPWGLFAPDLPRDGAPPVGSGAAGMFFFPHAAGPSLQAEVTRALDAFQWNVRCWRRVPVDRETLAPGLSDGAPEVWQALVVDLGASSSADARLYRARLRLDRLFEQHGSADGQRRPEPAVVSLSRRTIVYKGLLDPDRLAAFYPDLRDSRFESRLAIVHERFSTNTFPRWDLAQPFRVLAHNGEINTIAGNRLWMAARGQAVRTTGSDSQSLDDAVEAWRYAGCSLVQALTRVVPPAWERDARLSPDERAFFRFQACLSEPWDGPAAVAFSDGRIAGALLDRNGLRPARFVETAGAQFFLGSEAGIFDVPDACVRRRDRLGPGEMVAIDLESGRVRRAADLRRELAAEHPYREWTSRSVISVPERLPSVASDRRGPSGCLTRRQKFFGCTSEELALILMPMAEAGKEAVGSMGDDTPLASLSRRPRLFADFFRQRFAQVTNPPIDPLRERVVMSLEILLGPSTSLRAGPSTLLRAGPSTPLRAGPSTSLGVTPSTDLHYRRWLCLPSPVLTDAQFTVVCVAPGFRGAVIPMFFAASGGARALQHRLDEMIAAAENAVRDGAALLILSDAGVDESHVPMPPQLAVAAIHHGLIAAGLRMQASLVVDTGEARDAHQVATLLALGASAVVPSLGYETVVALATERGADREEWLAHYRTALDDGLLKIFSKMGISTASGYIGAQLLEILGLDQALADRWFPGVPCQLGGLDLDAIAREAGERHTAAFGPGQPRLDHPGLHGYRRDGEYHANNPALVRALHRAARVQTQDAYEQFARLAYERPPTALRDLLAFRPTTPIPLDEVEPAARICQRFFGAAMSVGALSPEAHRAIAIAMNRLGARSNSGEGGEEAERWHPLPGEPCSNSATKQVASARFGVTTEYLTSATELQIKIAQGSKPGEGGQLPAIKAVPHIARLRHAQPGIALISPPPHHDIYSIEDLAELIHDLREVNPRARVNVKLVAQAGVGIVAAGVAKAGADAILISGHDGGTGASPRGSIKHAGSPWELGLAETQQVLALNDLRHRVILQTDGGLKTGRDVTIAAALGADEFGFGTAALVAVGCVMARQCHLNTCPAGIATQREDLRQRFVGTPEMVVGYFRLLAEDVRRILAGLGLRSLAELVGRADLLMRKPDDACGVDVSPLLSVVRPRPFTVDQRNGDLPSPTSSLNARIVADTASALGIRPARLHYPIRNTDRAVGARIAGVIARRYGDQGAPQPVRLGFTGTAGQSFGAFLLPGISLDLTGETNDYLAKSMHGGDIVIRPPGDVRLPEGDGPNVLVGNTALYGATGGRVFVAGAAGERFAVRNSGAVAVVEGIGDHGCEYMTGGLVVVLGHVGRNFAAGMTGGRAYIWDPDAQIGRRCNVEMVQVHEVTGVPLAELLALVATHRELTGSRRAAWLLARWSECSRAFRMVVPVGVPAQTEAQPEVTGDLLAAVPARLSFA
ncbi:MAG: glutamate synthase large subunit [Acidobacteria bacterium]|nr:glutamate synthase large subunit [Acidobacteriota bacterium]